MENQILDENFDRKNLSSESNKKIIARINNVKIYANASIRDVKTGRTTLIVMGVFLILASTINVFVNNEEITITDTGEAFFKASIYIACAIGVPVNPKLSLILGLSFFLLVQVFLAFTDITSLLSGIIVKIPIVYFLGNGIIGYYKLLENAEELSLLGVSSREIELIKKLKEVPITL
jgi:hypothetical protein